MRKKEINKHSEREANIKENKKLYIITIFAIHRNEINKKENHFATCTSSIFTFIQSFTSFLNYDLVQTLLLTSMNDDIKTCHIIDCSNYKSNVGDEWLFIYLHYDDKEDGEI